MLIYDEINEEYYNVIPVKKVEEKIEELKEIINYLKQFGQSSRLHEMRVEKRVLQQLIKENTEEE